MLFRSFLRTQGETLIKSGREYRWKEHDLSLIHILEEVKRKGEAIFSAITTSNVYQVEWAVLVLELIDWVRRYQY